SFEISCQFVRRAVSVQRHHLAVPAEQLFQLPTRLPELVNAVGEAGWRVIRAMGGGAAASRTRQRGTAGGRDVTLEAGKPVPRPLPQDGVGSVEDNEAPQGDAVLLGHGTQVVELRG